MNKACMDTPYLGAVVKFLLGAATRVSFSVAGARAADHPSLNEVSRCAECLLDGTCDACVWAIPRHCMAQMQS